MLYFRVILGVPKYTFPHELLVMIILTPSRTEIKSNKFAFTGLFSSEHRVMKWNANIINNVLKSIIDFVYFYIYTTFLSLG